MSSVPLISVIVPIYRADLYLSSCVESILQQTHSNLELILVDDGSPDNCPAICDRYAESDARVIVIHQKNSGVSAARNKGLDAAKGEYIAFVDADDRVENDYLSYLFYLLEKTGSSIAACNHYIAAKGKNFARFPVSSEVRSFSKEEAYRNILYHRSPDVSTWGKLYTRSMFDHLRYPDGYVFEDTWTIAELIEQAGSLAYGSEPKYYYTYRVDTISKSAPRDKMWDFWDAVCHLTGVILRSNPELSQGCTRRKVHAALSIRRLLVHSDLSAKGDIERCQAIIQSNAKSVLSDPYAPLRDKAGIVLSFLGRTVFDAVWDFYQKIRRDY